MSSKKIPHSVGEILWPGLSAWTEIVAASTDRTVSDPRPRRVTLVANLRQLTAARMVPKHQKIGLPVVRMVIFRNLRHAAWLSIMSRLANHHQKPRPEEARCSILSNFRHSTWLSLNAKCPPSGRAPFR